MTKDQGTETQDRLARERGYTNFGVAPKTVRQNILDEIAVAEAFTGKGLEKVESAPLNVGPLIWARFGNAFVATASDGTLYVISLYLGVWSAYYAEPGQTEAREAAYGPTGDHGLDMCRGLASEHNRKRLEGQ
jgi:hypothetical protein